MSDLIIFPKIGEGLNRQLEDAMARQNYEEAYDIINDMERHIELSEQQQLIKLEVLLKLGSFIELREESSILLNQGHSSYDVVINYFLESLFALEQYQTVVELIESLRSEKLDQALLMQLLPLYDAARHQLNEREKKAVDKFRHFQSMSESEQYHLMLELIQSEQSTYIETVKYLLEQPLDAKVQTLMIEYLLLNHQAGIIHLMKFGDLIQLNLAELPHLQDTRMMTDVYPQVIDWFDNNAPSLSSAVAEWLNMQQMLLYPLDYRDGEGRLFDVQEIVDSHVLYLTELFAIEQPQHIEETDRHVEIIRQIKSIEMKEH